MKNPNQGQKMVITDAVRVRLSPGDRNAVGPLPSNPTHNSENSMKKNGRRKNNLNAHKVKPSPSGCQKHRAKGSKRRG